MEKINRVCHFNKLTIRHNGDIFPCCVAPHYTKLGSLFDEDIIEKINSKNIQCSCELYNCREKTPEDKPNLNYMHIEYSHICQGRCVCCFQEKNQEISDKEFIEKTNKLINYYKPKNITVLGGEVLIQKQSLDMLEDFKQKNPDIKLDIITNLCVDKEILFRASKIFSSMTVSFLGFNENSYKLNMGLDFNKTLENYNYLSENTDIILRPKFLCLPTNLSDLKEFLEWAINERNEKIYIHNLHPQDFGKIITTTTVNYWENIFKHLSKTVKNVLEQKKEIIISQQRHFISFHRFIANKIEINEEYLKSIGLDEMIKITN